jgi:hypothetical protein
MDMKILKPGVEAYKKRTGRYPVHLDELKRVGLIDRVPRDYTGNDYLYDNRTGKISSKRTYRWKKLF